MELEGAMHLADIWVNGKHVTQHAGGYTPFVIEVSKLLRWDKPNEILVRFDNKRNHYILPGKTVETIDINYYGGLYRVGEFCIKG